MITDRLPSFPLPFPDETVFSLVARYHALSGIDSGSSTIARLFGRSVITHSALPRFLNDLVSRFPRGYPMDAVSLIEHHTVFPYLRPFILRQRADAVISECRTGVGTTIMPLLAAVGVSHEVRFCVQCAKEDVQERGQPYWRRSHQLPGVFVCVQHDTVLFEYVDTPLHPRRYALRLPHLTPEAAGIAPSIEPRLVHKATGLSRLARLSATLFTMPTLALTPLHLVDCYIGHAHEKGFMRRGRIDIEALAGAVSDAYADIRGFSGFEFLGTAHASAWLSELLRRRRSVAPIKHIVLASVFVEKLADLLVGGLHFEAPKESESSGEERPAALWTESLPRLLVTEGWSMSKAAAALGVTTTTVKIHAERLNIPINRRPKTIDDVLRSRVEEAIRAGDPADGIAIRYGISKTSVARIVASKPALRKERESQAFCQRRDQARHSMQMAFASVRGEGVKAARRLAPADYAWLYRNDRQWLNEQSVRNKAAPKKRASPVDWNERDAVLATRIARERVRFFMSEKGRKPTRITRKALARASEAEVLIERYIKKLPMTDRMLTEYSESQESFRARRIEWAIEQLRASGEKPKPYAVVRLASLRSSPEVNALVASHLEANEEG